MHEGFTNKSKKLFSTKFSQTDGFCSPGGCVFLLDNLFGSTVLNLWIFILQVLSIIKKSTFCTRCFWWLNNFVPFQSCNTFLNFVFVFSNVFPRTKNKASIYWSHMFTMKLRLIYFIKQKCRHPWSLIYFSHRGF